MRIGRSRPVVALDIGDPPLPPARLRALPYVGGKHESGAQRAVPLRDRQEGQALLRRSRLRSLMGMTLSSLPRLARGDHVNSSSSARIASWRSGSRCSTFLMSSSPADWSRLPATPTACWRFATLGSGDPDGVADHLPAGLDAVDHPASRASIARAVLELEASGGPRPAVAEAAIAPLSADKPSVLLMAALLAGLSAEVGVRPTRLAGLAQAAGPSRSRSAQPQATRRGRRSATRDTQ